MSAALRPEASRGVIPAWMVPTLVLIAATSVAAWASAPYLVGVFHDDGVYALLAQSIAAGRGFHYSNLPGNPAATHYPPLYPLLLSVLWRIAPPFPDNVPILLGLNALLVGAAALGWWHVATRRGGWPTISAGAGALVCTLMLPTLALASALLSETLFLAALWMALEWCEGVDSTTTTKRVAIAGALVGALMLVRAHAIALLAAAVLVLAFRREMRQAGIVLAVAVAVQLPWIIWSAMATPQVVRPLEGAYGSYVGWFATGIRDGGTAFMAGTIRHNLSETWLFLEDRFAAGFPRILHYVTMATVFAALARGLVALWHRARVTVVFAILYAAVMLVWPYNPWRFVWAVWPLLGFFVLTGFRALWTEGGRWRTAAAVLAVLPAFAVLRVELHSYATKDWLSSANAGAAQIHPVIQWVHAQTAPDDVILSEGEPVLALYDGALAAPPVSFTAREYLAPPSVGEGALRLSEMLLAQPAKYVILFDPMMIRSAKTLANTRPGLRVLQPLPAGVVFQVLR